MTPAALETLARYVAESLFLFAFADACDRARDDGHSGVPHPGAGGDWADIVPGEVPAQFVDVARQSLAKIPAPVLDSGMEAWQRLTDRDAERFAHVTAATMLGHGIGYDDDMSPSSHGIGYDDDIGRHAVERLRQALPRIGESCAVFLEWNPETERCE